LAGRRDKRAGDLRAAEFANLIKLAGARYVRKISAPAAPAPAEAETGNPPPGVLVKGKPYAPTAAQRVQVPRGLTREQERRFLQRDLEAALAYEPTPEEMGEFVIDLTKPPVTPPQRDETQPE
jgi:hypothetical protein